MLKEKLILLVKSIPGLYWLISFALMIWTIIKSRSLRTILDNPPGHFYSPLPNIKEVIRDSDILFEANTSIAAIDLKNKSQFHLLKELGKYISDLPFERVKKKSIRYYYDNKYFGDGDAVILYTLLRHFQPTQLIEVGSGFSSAVILDTNELFFNDSIKITFIEPYTERLSSLLSDNDKENCSIIESKVQSVPISLFEKLNANDILFIDSSHVVKIGSDVAHILFNILPTLKPGVLIHFHDILWPFEYPESWVIKGIAWNEAYFIRAFLQFNTNFEIVYFNSYIGTLFPEELVNNIPMELSNPGGSLWLRKIA